MEKLFGIPMTTLAVVLFGIVAMIGAALVVMAWRNRLFFRMAVRNIPRRPAQSALIVAGLTLSTTIIAAALSIGDTVTGSIRGVVLEGLGGTDVRFTSATSLAFGDAYMPESRISEVRAAVEGDSRVDGVLPEIRETLPVVAPRTGKTEARTMVLGFDPESLEGFEGATGEEEGPIDLASLGVGETVVNTDLAAKLDLRAGDSVDVVTASGRHTFKVKAVARRGGLAGSDPRALVTLDAMQQAVGQTGQITAIEVSTTGAGREAVALSGELADDLRVKFTDEASAAKLFSALRDPAVIQLIERQTESSPQLPPGLKKDFGTLVSELKRSEMSDEFKTQIAKTEVIGVVFVALEQAEMRALALELLPEFGRLRAMEVDGIKKRLSDLADLIGNFVTTFFTIFGTFSIIVGLLLIFLVFVMLAAARMGEMGISRAMGMKRGQLVQMFTFEGFIYATVGSIIGTALGVALSLVLVQLLARIFSGSGDEAFVIRYTMQARSLVAAFSAGLLLTAITVIFSAYRVSKLNIVVAIRGLAQEFVRTERPRFVTRLLGLGLAIVSPLRILVAIIRAVLNKERVLPHLVRLLLSLVIVPWIAWIVAAIGRLIWPYIEQGWLLFLIGAYLLMAGIRVEQASLFTTGVSTALIGLALTLKLLLRRTKMRVEDEDRIAYTFLGVSLLVFWSLPFDTLESITGELNSNIEMFIISGVWMVAAATWTVIYNADMLLWVLSKTIGRSGRMRPVIKMAIAYPVAARFRTGLTLAMFALVIFTMIVLAILNNLGSVIKDEPDRVTGGYDVTANISSSLPVSDMDQAIEDSSLLDERDFVVVAAQAQVPAEARQVGAKEQRFIGADLRISDDQFLTTNLLRITHYDPAYGDTSREIWDAVAADSRLVVVSQAVISESQDDFGGFSAGFKAEGVDATKSGPITAFEIELRPPIGQASKSDPVKLTVIGVVDAFADQLNQGPQDEGEDGDAALSTGSVIYGGPSFRTAFSEEPVEYTQYMFNLADPAEAVAIASTLETAFLDNSMRADSTAEQIDRSLEQNQAFNQLFQGFMGLGLMVGVAALGVISFRAVVERRQSIGMLRALGFRANMVRTQFLIESSFVAALGAAMGIGLGTIISWNIVNDIGTEVEGLKFSIPWFQVALITLVALGFSLLMTLAPAQQAAKIYPSEALRYE